MIIRIQKWGNSDGIRIPSSFLKALNLKTNDKIDLIQEGESLIITKINKKHLTFEERVSKYEGEKMVEDYDWGEPMGKEIW